MNRPVCPPQGAVAAAIRAEADAPQQGQGAWLAGRQRASGRDATTPGGRAGPFLLALSSWARRAPNKESHFRDSLPPAQAGSEVTATTREEKKKSRKRSRREASSV